jgi:hypothetical protein
MEHCSPRGDIARFVERVAEGRVQIQEAGRVSRDRYFFHESKTYRRHPPGFDFSGEQSRGPRAEEKAKQEQAQLNRQQAQLDALKRLVCSTHPRAKACK